MQNDEILIAGCKDGNRSSQKALYEKYNSLLMGICYRYSKNFTDAEDILQETFIKIFSSIKQFRNEGSFEGWMRRIAVTTALNYMNQNKHIRESLAIESMAYEVPQQSEEASIRLNGKDLMDCIQSLPDGFRTVLNLHAVEGYSHRQIADMLQISESTSRSQYSRAKVLLAMRILEQNKILIPVEKAR
jgi:RNA polymerase sigma factor (sigma-70 family)